MTHKILLVDDEESVRKTLLRILQEEYSIDVAVNGSEAIKKSLENDYDLILVDLKMPDINGIEVIKKIKKEKPDVKLAIITGFYEEYKNMVNEVEPQISGVIIKPVELEEFRQKIKELLT